ncbi:MAG: hypothetical protein IIY94_05715, partial [Oscillospiraceae bacterium]|nr:hypothetical protein [Oscillospiraceae bacterium]
MDKNTEKDLKKEAPQQDQLKLDDARRVKVLSPGMLVFKRFVRNKLAVTGIVILVIMFIYAWLGPVFSPYSRAQVFTKIVEEAGDYATGKFNTDPRLVGDDSSSMNSAVLKALGTTRDKSTGSYALTAGQEIPFEVKSEPYTLRVINPNPKTPTVGVFGTQLLATVDMNGNVMSDINAVDDALKAALIANFESGSKETSMEY